MAMQYFQITHVVITIFLQEVKKRLSNEVAAAANRDGRWRNQTHRAAYNGCCHRVAQIRVLHSALWKLLTVQKLIQPLTTIEIPLVSLVVTLVC